MSTVVMTAVMLGSSLVGAEDLSVTSAQANPTGSVVVPPIVSPRTDPSVEMPAGGPGAAPDPAVPPTAGPAEAVVPPPVAIPAVVERPPGVDIKPRVPVAGGGFVEGQSVEVVSKRTERSKTFRNPDGTFTEKISATVQRYPGADGKWVEIDDHLVADPSGGYRNRANVFTARFLPGASGVRLETPEGTIGMVPVGGTFGSPVVDPAGETVTYPDVWPGVDARYRVAGQTLKEELVLRQPTTTAAYGFVVTGTALMAQPDGSLAAGGAYAGRWRIERPVVFDKNGRAATEAVPVFSVTGDVVTLAVSNTWLAGLGAADFPVVLDPSWQQVGAPTSRGYLT